MMPALEWIRFGVSAVLLIFGLFCFAAAVLGVFRFGFVMNRVHASGIGDTLGLLCVIASCVISCGVNITSAKLILVLVFLWFTSPVSAHFLGQVEFTNNRNPGKYMRFVTIPGRPAGGRKAEAERKAEAGSGAEAERKAETESAAEAERKAETGSGAESEDAPAAKGSSMREDGDRS